jgi:site-specific recombinase XerD
VTQLRKTVLEELERRNYSQATARSYVGAIRRLAKYFHRSPDQLDLEQIREYQLHMIKRGLRPKTVMIQMAAFRFLFTKVLKRRYTRDDLPLPKTPKRQVPVVLSREEVARLIECASNLRHRTILMALYATGMRRSELCLLRTEDIDKERMVITSVTARAARRARFR